MTSNNPEIENAYSPDVLQRIADIAIEAGADHQERLDDLPRVIRHWAGMNVRIWRDEAGRLNWKDIQKELTKANKSAAQLKAQLENMDMDAQALLWETAADLFIDHEHDGEGVSAWDAAPWVDELEKSITTLEALTRLAADRAADKKLGPQATSKAASVRRHAVGELGTIWLWLTGGKPTRIVRWQDYSEYGPFKDFVIACLAPLSPPVGRDLQRGIDGDIKAVSAGMGKNPDAYRLSFLHTTD